MTDTVSAPHDAPIAHVADGDSHQDVHTAGERKHTVRTVLLTHPADPARAWCSGCRCCS